MKIGLVTDSTADLPQDLAEKNNIHVIPTILIMDGESIEDGSGISRNAFYDKLPTLKSLPTTAAPAVGTFQQVYEKLFQRGYQQILSIHVAGALSGVVNAAYMAAQAFNERVHVMESGQASMGLGFQALYAAEAIARGEPLQAVIAYIKNIQKRIRLVAMLDTLEYIRRSGRVSWAKATFGSLLNIKPLVELHEGRVMRIGEARTRLKGLFRIVETIKSLPPLDRLAMLHTNAEADIRQILNELNTKLSAELTHQPPLVVNVTPIIGTHVGPKGVGFVSVTLS